MWRFGFIIKPIHMRPLRGPPHFTRRSLRIRSEEGLLQPSMKNPKYVFYLARNAVQRVASAFNNYKCRDTREVHSKSHNRKKPPPYAKARSKCRMSRTLCSRYKTFRARPPQHSNIVDFSARSRTDGKYSSSLARWIPRTSIIHTHRVVGV